MGNEVSDIIAKEPIITEPDGETKWVECTIEWDEEHGAFINRESKEDWHLDEYAHQDSTYMVDGEEYSRKEESIHAAMGDKLDEFEDTPPILQHYRL